MVEAEMSERGIWRLMMWIVAVSFWAAAMIAVKTFL